MTTLLRPDSAQLINVAGERQFQFWSGDRVAQSPDEIAQMYADGNAGVWHDPVAIADFENMIVGSGGNLDGESVAKVNGLSGSGEGRLVAPFVFVMRLFPGCWPGAAQQVGDCVSHDTKNAALTTMSCDIVSGKPDEETGQVECSHGLGSPQGGQERRRTDYRVRSISVQDANRGRGQRF